MAHRRNQIPSAPETKPYFGNNMLIAFCVQPSAIFLHSAGKFIAVGSGCIDGWFSDGRYQEYWFDYDYDYFSDKVSVVSISQTISYC